MEAKDIYQLAKILLAAESKKRDKNLIENLRNEKYQRTFTDEYSFAKKPRAGFRRVTEEKKREWAALANRGES